MRLLYAMLVLVPIAGALQLLGAPASVQFCASCLAIVPLAGLMGAATEEFVKYRGASVGGLVNATFGNATELIIGIVALTHNEFDVVKASLIGSIIGNILLVLGASVLVGGLRYKIQKFRQDVAQNHATMLGMAVVSLLVPALVVRDVGISERPTDLRVENLSLGVAGVLLLLYVGSLVFALRTHEALYRCGDEEESAPPTWSQRTAVAVLLVCSVLIAFESEVLVRAIGPAVAALGVTKIFLGVIVIPIIGNAAEHSTAVLMAYRDKMDISLNIAVSSSTQIAMFVAPMLIFVGRFTGHPITVLFSNIELVALTAAAVIAVLISMDGESHWLEGAQLLATYIIVALAFFFVVR